MEKVRDTLKTVHKIRVSLTETVVLPVPTFYTTLFLKIKYDRYVDIKQCTFYIKIKFYCFIKFMKQFIYHHYYRVVVPVVLIINFIIRTNYTILNRVER